MWALRDLNCLQLSAGGGLMWDTKFNINTKSAILYMLYRQRAILQISQF
jgi:hypothetical protein